MQDWPPAPSGPCHCALQDSTAPAPSPADNEPWGTGHSTAWTLREKRPLGMGGGRRGAELQSRWESGSAGPPGLSQPPSRELQ